jgi:hypothetical protein|tara:strand:- start:39 stop:641 length:603 start_codon:yes stop_codon:yes gene_type:complete
MAAGTAANITPMGQNSVVSQAAEAAQTLRDTNESSGGLLGQIEKLEQLISTRGGNTFLGRALQNSLNAKIEEYNNNALRTGGRKYGESADDPAYLARVAERRASREAMGIGLAPGGGFNESSQTYEQPKPELGVVPSAFRGDTLEQTVIGGVPSSLQNNFSQQTLDAGAGVFGTNLERYNSMSSRARRSGFIKPKPLITF